MKDATASPSGDADPGGGAGAAAPMDAANTIARDPIPTSRQAERSAKGEGARRSRFARVTATARSEAKGSAHRPTVPASVEARFQRNRRSYYFPDGSLAFIERGSKLIASTHNGEVVHSLIDIAEGRWVA